MWLIAAGIALVGASNAAPAMSTATTTTSGGYLAVFLDCVACDADFAKTEMPYVDFVRDRKVSDVDVLVTTQTTGSGGNEYTIALLGLGRFDGVNDTLRHVTPASATTDEIRHGLVHAVKIGLARYLAHTPALENLDLDWSAPEGATALANTVDPWHAWTFRLSGSGFFSGQQTTSSVTMSGSASANHVTDAWKLNLTANTDYSQNEYQFDGPPVTKYTSISRSSSVNGQAVRSLSPRWSADASASASQSTFSNEALLLDASSGVEFDVFPYSQSTRRLLTLSYAVTEQYARYIDETIYGRASDFEPQETLGVTLNATQPWGTVGLGLSGSNYFLQGRDHSIDVSKNEGSAFMTFDVKLLKGFSVNGLVDYSAIRDQIFLSAVGATPEEILLQRKQLATSYQYSVSLGLSYTFGSIFSGVVNPRFGGGSTTSSIIIME